MVEGIVQLISCHINITFIPVHEYYFHVKNLCPCFTQFNVSVTDKYKFNILREYVAFDAGALEYLIAFLTIRKVQTKDLLAKLSTWNHQ